MHEKFAVGISLAGIAFLIEPYKLTLQLGDGLALVGMVGYSYTIVLMNQLLQREKTSVVQVSFLCVAGTAFYFSWVALYFVLFRPDWLAVHIIPADAHTIASILSMILFVSIVSNLLQSVGQRKLSPIVVSIVFCMEPFVTAILDYLMLGNIPSIGVILCGLLLVLATITASMKKVKEETSVGA